MSPHTRGFPVGRRSLSIILALLLPAAPARGQAKRAIQIDEFVTQPTVGDPQINPEGTVVAYTISTPSLEDNKSTTKIWMVEVGSGDSWQVTTGSGNDRAPRWSPDGRTLAFISSREKGSQIWRLPVRGGEPTRVTDLPQGVGDFLWSPDGKALFFTADVAVPDSTEALRRAAPFPTDARIWTELLYRHWDEWRVGIRSHVFRITLADKEVSDITPIARDVPPLALGGRDIAVSPVGTEVAVVFNPDSSVATSTNNDIFLMGPDGSDRQAITTSPANDNSPLYSPDGRHIAYLAMSVPGFEADRQQIVLYERATGKRTPLAPKWDVSVSAIQWAPDARALIAEVEQRGEDVLYRVDVPTGRANRVVEGGVNSGVQIAQRGDVMVFLRQTSNHPAEIYAASLDGGNLRALTKVHDERLAQLDLPAAERFGFVGALNDSVFGWIVKPPGFDARRKYPLVYLIHGGPQGAWLDQWHARWNYQLFASRGYVVAAVNFHGSTGYGQKFTNSISRNWGSYPFDDLMKGADYLSTLPYVDKSRMAAAGASYGGYMIYWMAGHTDRFRTLVAHDGVFNPLSMAGATEELWFPVYEFGGSQLAPAARATMEKWSPANYISNWVTPMLIVHGEQDFRVPFTEGLQAFTALKLRGVPAKFLDFPDEGHFVLKPRNRRLWWNTVLDWLDEYLKERQEVSTP